MSPACAGNLNDCELPFHNYRNILLSTIFLLISAGIMLFQQSLYGPAKQYHDCTAGRSSTVLGDKRRASERPATNTAKSTSERHTRQKTNARHKQDRQQARPTRPTVSRSQEKRKGECASRPAIGRSLATTWAVQNGVSATKLPANGRKREAAA